MKKVLLLLAKGFETIEAGVFIDVFGWNNSYGDEPVGLVLCGLNNEVTGSFNVKVRCDITTDRADAEDFDALAFPGGFGTFGFYSEADSAEFQNLIRDFDSRGKVIASVCVAAIPLGKSGILKDKLATTYNKNGGKRQKQLEQYCARVVNEPVVVDGNIITSWNPSTAFEVAFILLEKMTSKDNADKIREIMGF